MILSIDVGIKNLAMCLFEQGANVVHQWDVSGVPAQHENGLYSCLRDHLNAREWTRTANVILIEKQPNKSQRMKYVEHFLEAYFTIQCPNSQTIIYDARHKVPDVVGSGKAQYRARKNTSIVRCRQFLESTEVNKHWLPVFDKSKKKDDLADTVMQALSFRGVVSKEPPPKKKLVARKPTENQKRTKYSQSNLAWMVKNKSLEELEKDKRFQKDLKRYYHSIDEIKSLMA